jgi:replication fork protection complex subunit Csm3/Swi3
MVEKAGHKKRLASARNEWISQRPKQTDDDDDESPEENTRSAAHFSAAVNATSDKPSTPSRDVPDDDDLYDATPRAARQTAPPADVPEDDDLDALMAEAEANDQSKQSAPTSTGPKAGAEDDGDELDALIAEAEGTSNGSKQVSNGEASKKPEGSNDDFADEEAAMQEMDGLW